MRTKHTLYNFIVSVIASVLLPLVGFIKVRLFVDLYGSDVNGLQLTIAQIITFLNICELAFSLAFRQLLFKPLAEDDKEKVKKIYNGARKVFKIKLPFPLVSFKLSTELNSNELLPFLLLISSFPLDKLYAFIARHSQKSSQMQLSRNETGLFSLFSLSFSLKF